MKVSLVCLLLVAAVGGAPAIAKSPHGSPLLGRWAVVTSRLPMPPAERPRKVVIAFRQAAQARLTMDVDIVYADGKEVHSVSTTTPDGVSFPVTGSPEADLGAIRMPQPDALILALSKHGVPASTRIYTVAADGQHMTETAVYYDKDGHPIMQTHYFTRMGPRAAAK